MKFRLCNTLILLVLFMIASTMLIAQTRAFSQDDVSVTIDPLGPIGDGGEVIIGTRVIVELVDPDFGHPADELDSASVNFRRFWSSDPFETLWIEMEDNRPVWTAEYTVVEGDVNNLDAYVAISAQFADPDNSQTLVITDQSFMTNNIPVNTDGFVLTEGVLDATPDGLAKVGSTITATFVNDGSTYLDADVTVTVDFSPFGGNAVEVMTYDAVNENWYAEYVVVQGNIAGSFPIVSAILTSGNPNRGYVESSDVQINNIILDSGTVFISHQVTDDEGGVAIVGSTIVVYLENGSGYPLNATADFSQFGLEAGDSVEMVLVDTRVPDPNPVYRAEYTITPCNVFGNGNVVVTANIADNPNEDVVLTTLDIPFDSRGLTADQFEVAVEVQDPGLDGETAIIGSTIVATLNQFCEHDIEAVADFSLFGGPASVNMVLVDGAREPDNVYQASYTVESNDDLGVDILGEFSVAIQVNIVGSINILELFSDDVAVDNVLPDPLDYNDDGYIAVNNDGSSKVLAIGDDVYVYATFDVNIGKVWIDWERSFPDSPARSRIDNYTPYLLTNGDLTAVYTPEMGTLHFDDDLTVFIVALETVQGNFLNLTNDLRIDQTIEISGNLDGDPVVASTSYPTVQDDLDFAEDLYYDHIDGYLRFSPESPESYGYSTNPDVLEFLLRLPTWEVPGGLYSFRLRIEFEGRNVHYRTFTKNSPEVVSDVDGNLTVVWDGTNDEGDFLAEGTWGLTLWDVYDEVGNHLHLGDNFAITGEHPFYPSQLDNGIVILNRMHVVVDNTPMEFVQDLETDDPLTFTRNIDNYTFTGDMPAVDFTEVYYDDDHDNADFDFRIRRGFLVDSNDLRREKGRYWVVLSDNDNNISWFWNGVEWLDYDNDFDFDNSPDQLVFPSDTAQNANPVSFNWNIDQQLPDESYLFQPANYQVAVYVQDNAGNVGQSSILSFVINEIETDYEFDENLAHITGIEIMSEHDGGPYGFDAYDAFGNHIFYLNAGDYYSSIDEIEIRIFVNNPTYLQTGNSVLLDLTNLGLGEVWKTELDFVEDGGLFFTNHTITNQQMQSIPETMAGQWTIGSELSLGVYAYSVYTDQDLEEQVYESAALPADHKVFNLLIADAPIWPVLDDAVLTVDKDYISPGNPSFTYNAVSNPAKDGVRDMTELDIYVPESSEPVQWEVTITNPVNNRVKTWTGSLAANTDHAATFEFFGLDNDLVAMVDALEEQELQVKLVVSPVFFADAGYHDPPEPLTVIEPLIVDNVKPELVSGAGVDVSATYDITVDVTPVVSGLDRIIPLTLYTSEPLRTDNLNILGSTTPGSEFYDAGWNALVVDDNGSEIDNNGSPVLATVLTAMDVSANGTYAYELEIEITGTSGDFEYENATLVVRLPWDEAGNPARYNNPVYPYGEDVFHNDSSEGYLKFHILNARPDIARIEFTNHNSVTIADFEDPAQDEQGYVAQGDFTVTALITGGIYDAGSIATSFKADLTTLLGAAFDAVAPVTVVDVTTRTANESLIWLATWEGTIDGAMFDTFGHLEQKEVSIFVGTNWDDNPVHETEASLIVWADIEIPVVNQAFETVNAGAYTIQYEISDADAGVYWDSSEIMISDPSVVFDNRIYDDVLGTISWDLIIPEDVQNFIVTLNVMDDVHNELVDVRHINVLPTPIVSNVVINDGFTHFRPGTDVDVHFDLEHFERVEEIVVELDTTPPVSQTLTTGFADAMTVTFDNVVIPHLDVLTATVTVHTMQYSDVLEAASLALTEVSTDNADVIADDVEPMIVAEGDVAELITVIPQFLTYTVTDVDAGVDWATAQLEFNPNVDINIVDSVITGDEITWEVIVAEATDLKMVVATVTVDDNVGNTATLTRYLNIRPIPVIGDVLVQDITQVPANEDWWVPHHTHELEVSFSVENFQRVSELTITLSADGQDFAAKTILEADVLANNVVLFHDDDIFGVGLLDMGALDGELVTATVTGHTHSYDAPDADLVVETPLVSSEGEIMVDTKPVITDDLVFLMDGEVINTLLPDINDLQIVVTVRAPNDVTQPVIDMDGVLGVFTYGAVTMANDLDNDGNRIQVFTYNDVAFADLDVDPATFELASFKVNTSTIYGYEADEYNHDMVVLGYTEFRHYGVLANRNFDGTTPDGWFAPEHQFMTEYQFVSTVDAVPAPIIGDFDLIEDNVPENWRSPNLTDQTVFPVILNQGGNQITVNIYHYLATWEITPDYQSVWNAYDDGEEIQIDYVYQQFIGPIEVFSSVRVDKDVPVYDKNMYWIAIAQGDDAPVYQSIDSSAIEDYRTINLPLTPPAPGEFAQGNHVYLKVRASDGNGIGVGWIELPTVAGWDIAEHNDYLDNGFFYQEWKLTPQDYDAIDDSSQLTIQLSEVEDLVGHKNYAGDDYEYQNSNLYVGVAPSLTFNFTAGDNDGSIATIRAFQKIPGDPLNNMTSPYIRPGADLGFTLELTQIQTRAVEVQSIRPLLVEINTPRGTDALDNNWVALDRIDPTDDFFWFLNAPLAVNPEDTDETLGLNYRITYEITYVDLSTQQETYTSAWITSYEENGEVYDLIVIDRDSPQFVQDGILVKSVAYPDVSDNYVIPGYETEISIRFTEVSNYYHDTTKPAVTINDLDSFIDGVPAVYNVDPDDINFNVDENVWIAHVTGLMATSNPGITSQIITVTLNDVVGNDPVSATKFVEIANQGPIVPLIVDVKMITNLWDNTEVDNYLVKVPAGQAVPSRIEIYIDTQYAAYIDDVSVDHIDDIEFTFNQIREANAPEDGQWVAVFDVVASDDLVGDNGDEIEITVRTSRHPYGQPVFNQAETFSVTIDGDIFDADQPLVQGIGVEDIDYIINPELDMRVTVTVHDLGELVVGDILPANPILSDWFGLHNIAPDLLDELLIPAGLVTGDDDSRTVTWHIPADAINDLALESSLRITYKNIYGLEKFIDVDFFIDTEAPIIADNGIHFITADAVIENAYNANDPITLSEDWTSFKVYLNDPEIIAAVDGSGLNYGKLQLIPRPATYQATNQMQALAAYFTDDLMTDVDGNHYLELVLDDVMAGFTAFDLAIGYYDIIVEVQDKLENEMTYVQPLYFDQAETSIVLAPFNNGDFTLETSEESKVLHALVNDPNGTVNGVHFRLYYDADADGEFTPGVDPEYTDWDILPSVGGNPDMTPPFQAEWQFTDRTRYNWVPDANYDQQDLDGNWIEPINSTREFWLRVTAISQSRYITDHFELVEVTDDVAPVPEIPTATYHGAPVASAIVYDYVDTDNNVIELHTEFIGWPDARQARFEITKLNSIEDTIVIESDLLANPTDAVTVEWNFSTRNDATGSYQIAVKGIDWVGNVLDEAILMLDEIEIINPASSVDYTIAMNNIIDLNNQPEIVSPALYGGTVNPVGNIVNLRLSAAFNHLNGIERVRFMAEKINNVTGDVENLAVPNNPDFQNDYVIDADGWISADQIVVHAPVDPTVFIFVPEDFYETLDEEDITFRFFVELEPTNPVEDDLFVDHAVLSIDNRAPQLAITGFTMPMMSWNQPGTFIVDGILPDYDIDDIDGVPVLQWRIDDNDDWKLAVFNTVTLPDVDDFYFSYNNWDVSGGSVDTYLGENFEGEVQMRVVAVDAMGNESESDVVLPYVDNNAPETHFTHVIHSMNYPALTTVTDGETIQISTSTASGASNLQLFVDHTILDADAVMPLMMYHGKPEVAGIVWQPVAYDHDHWNLNDPSYPSMYEFFIPADMLNAGTHYFTVVARDAMGNLEGDTASDTHAYTDSLNDDEKMAAVNLTVEVISIDDVIAKIGYPNELDFISGIKAITAYTEDDLYNAVEWMRFEHNDGGMWQELATIEKDVHSLSFELHRSDLPQFDGLPLVPGVHLFANGVELAELEWDNATESWSIDNIELTVGVNYNFQYGIDINNNGMYDPGEPMIDDPKGFVELDVTPWVYAFDSTQFAQGLHEFRAVPLDINGDELEYYDSVPTLFLIDNVPPTINTLTAVGNIQTVQPGDEVTFVTDLEELLVAADDVVEVMYQYSGQPEGSINRAWNAFGSTNVMAGNYPMAWDAVNPLTDGIDNNNNGLVDDPTEADAYFYIRAIARDRAGNYTVSDEYAILVDGSPAKMVLTAIDGIELNTVNYIFSIPADADEVVLTAEDITDPQFDEAADARFEYRYRLGHMLPWTAWEEINEDVVFENGAAHIVFTDIHEAYYQFRVYGIDTVGNEDANPAVTSVVFNDVTGPGIAFTSVGARDVISGEFAFANDSALFAGELAVQLDNFDDVNTVTFEYSLNGVDNWENIATTSIIPANGIVSVPWLYPNLRSPLLYLRAIAQDAGANNMGTEVVKLYHDTVAPSIEVISLTHSIVDVDKMVLDTTEDIELEIQYGNLIEDTILDVASIMVSLVGTTNDVVLPLQQFANVNEAETSFIFEVADIAGLPDGVYHLEFEVTDFADNTEIIIPADYMELYIDTTPPAGLAITAVDHINNIAVYTEEIDFRVDYNDLIGVPASDAFTAAFTYQNVSQIVDDYDIVEEFDAAGNVVGEYIHFTWMPSVEFQQFIINGEMNIIASVEVSVTDFLNQEAILVANNFFTLTYGVPANVRLMAVTDFVNNQERVNYVNWNLANPAIVEMLGTNRTPGAAAEPLELFAYVPHLAEIPNSVTFQYKLVGSADWTDIATVAVGDQWNFIDPDFLAQYARQYSAEWDIVGMPAGEYEIKTIAEYPVANSESIVTVNLYDGFVDDVIIPELTINSDNGFVERGETYQVTSPSFAGMSDFLTGVVYKYRYVEEDAGVITPVSQWMFFGDQNGAEEDSWIAAPYTYEWTIYPYYLYNNKVQIVGFAQDKWGTETPITNIIDSGNYVTAHITDTIAPEINDIVINWNGLVNPDWVSGLIEDEATVKATITTNVSPNDIASVQFFFNDELIGTYLPASGLSQLDTDEYEFAVPTDMVASGEIKIVAMDVYDNENEVVLTINIDNELPAADLIATIGGVEIDTLERETTVLLDAQATDLPSGVATVVYEYRNELDPVWINIADLTDDPFTVEWDVPADLIYGDTYIVKATVTDRVGHAIEVEEEFVVTDNDTEIIIVSVAGHEPVNGIIPVRLHGEFEVVTNAVSPQIPRLEFLIRELGTTDWRELDPIYLTDVFDHTAFMDLDELPSGHYELGVAPHGRRNAEPVDYVQITVDNDLDINVVATMPQTGAAFNGDMITVHFEVLADADGHIDNLDAANVDLLYEYIDPYSGTWYDLPNIAAMSTLDGVNWTAVFTNIDIQHNNVTNNGIYNFAIRVRDNALPEANEAEFVIAENVIFDTIDPNVQITAVDGVDDLIPNVPVPVELGSNVLIEADAYDILSGQIIEVASGINRLEFYYEFGANTVMLGYDETAPYEMSWNTLGYQTGTYTIIVKAFDNAGNEAEVAQDVTIVAPNQLQPYALITAMNFDADTANEDHIYAVTKTWNNEIISAVAFEYYDGFEWNEFTQAVQFPGYWKAHFNAEMMSDVVMVRPVVTYNDIHVSPIMPELEVSYSAENGGSLITDPAIYSELYYEDKINVFGTLTMPILTLMHDMDYHGTLPVQIVNGDYEATYIVDDHRLYTFWAASLDNNGNVQLAKTTLETHNIGTVSDDDDVISVTVPDNSYLYFQNVKHPHAVIEGLEILSAQKAVIAAPVQDLTYTVNLDVVPADEGTIVGLYHNGIQWVPVAADYNEVDNSVTFTAPSGHIYAAGQYTGVTIEAMFVSVDPHYTSPSNEIWTLENSEIKFFIYEGINQGGYETPLFGEFEYQLYVNDLLVLDNAVLNYDNGFVTYDAIDMPAGEHTTTLVVTKDGFTAIAEETFHVDVTAPVITAAGSQIDMTNRVVEANIVDHETGISNVVLEINGVTIPFQDLNVAANNYSYELTLEDLFAFGYTNGGVNQMQVTWSAENNLGIESDDYIVNYTVLIDGPAISFTGFDDGWWFNPTGNVPLTFDIEVSGDAIMPHEGVLVRLFEVIQGDPNTVIQTMTIAPESSVGNVYSYSVNMGYAVSPQANAVRMAVTAVDSYGSLNYSEQTYGIDYLPPTVWALSPVGDLIESEEEEEGLPPVYEPAVLDYGTDVTIGIGFEDVQGYVVLETGEWWIDWPNFWDHGYIFHGQDYLVYYTGASGIDQNNVIVTLNGDVITGTVTAGSFVANAGMLDPGEYTVIASVADLAGNVGTVSYTFTVVGGAPTITFNPEPFDDGGWWLNSTEENDLYFKVESQNLLAEGGVVAGLYTVPADAVLQGPITPTPVAGMSGYDDDSGYYYKYYMVTLQGGVVPEGQTGIRLEVSASDVWDGTSISNQVYGIDNFAPQIALHTPVNETIYAYGSTVNITATINDHAPARSALQAIGSRITNESSRDRAGSGLAQVTVEVISPANETALFSHEDGFDGNMIYTVAETMTAEEYGTYFVNITAIDNVGNQSVSSAEFTVPAPAPTITFNEIDGNGWWLNSTDENHLYFTVTSRNMIAEGGVVANIHTIPANDLLQGPITPTPVNSGHDPDIGYFNEYRVVLQGGVVPANQTGIKLEVNASNVLGGSATSNQVYGIDNHAPQITIQSPQADAQFAINNTVNIMAVISDLSPVRSLNVRAGENDRSNDRAGSGIFSVNLRVVGPTGATLVNEDYPANTQVVSYDMVVENYGNYTVYVKAVDNALNQSIASVSFQVATTSAPSVAFDHLDNGWWLSSVANNELTFTVDSEVDVAVNAEIHALPSGEILVGPMDVNATNGVYTVNIHGSVIPANANSVKLAVTVTDSYGLVGNYSQVYNVDKAAPMITAFTPETGTEIVLVDAQTQVNIYAEFQDLASEAGRNDRNGSGIANARLTLTDPNNSVSTLATTGAGETEISATVSNLMVGNYSVRLTVWDVAGNQVNESIFFKVVEAILPPEVLVINDAHIFPNPVNTELGATFSIDLNGSANVIIRIYDFAGREVRVLEQYASDRASATHVSWDGRNSNDQKLARGAYFARVIANDGKKIVEKVVKVAITQ